jgi:hypothetical protein
MLVIEWCIAAFHHHLKNTNAQSLGGTTAAKPRRNNLLPLLI